MPRGTYNLQEIRVTSYDGFRGKQRPRILWMAPDVQKAVIRIIDKELESGPERGSTITEWFQVLLDDGQIVWVCQKGGSWYLLAD